MPPSRRHPNVTVGATKSVAVILARRSSALCDCCHRGSALRQHTAEISEALTITSPNSSDPKKQRLIAVTVLSHNTAQSWQGALAPPLHPPLVARVGIEPRCASRTVSSVHHSQGDCALPAPITEPADSAKRRNVCLVPSGNGSSRNAKAPLSPGALGSRVPPESAALC